ncbi:hypothetical protein [Paenarthrobacter sp. NPDC058040]|uniref:hypothetical protein n=1 Tax=unclassified Paenarthrobacter TaxID=2634190 RepID=UPI0036DBB4D9
MTNETNEAVQGRPPTQPVGPPPFHPQTFAPPSFPPPVPQYYQPPQYAQQPFPYQGYSAPVPPSYSFPGSVTAPAPYPPSGGRAFGPSFWVTGSILAVVALVSAVLGNGEAILIFLGLAAVITGLYSLVFKRASWAALRGTKAAAAVAIAGAAALVLGGVAAGVESRRSSTAVSAPSAASSSIVEGVWLVGEDIAPGLYRTVEEVTDACYWRITRPGGGSDSTMGAVTSGYPSVELSRGQKFTTHGCGTWVRQ